MSQFIDLENQFGSHNYSPLPVVIVRGLGPYVWDENGKRYLDMMSAYSAISHGHCHPRLVKALTEQASQLSMISRAFYSDQLGPFLAELCKVTGYQQALPMNSGAEGVETALKAARKWATLVKGVPENKAEIIACNGNFHGRTIAIVSLSTEEQYRAGFGPFIPGVKCIPYGDAHALAAAITENTAAFLVEPIQGEGGIKVPPPGYLQKALEICQKSRVLMIADEIQTGLCRTGAWLACDHDGVKPDGLVLGKALGGGLLPVSAFLTSKEVMDVFTPGDHGSTFGGNPLASRVGLEALRVMQDENFMGRAKELGAYFQKQLRAIKSSIITDVRGKGLLIGLEINPNWGTGREFCERLLAQGILTKETHQTVVRLAPPLVVTREDIDFTIEAIKRIIENK